MELILTLLCVAGGALGGVIPAVRRWHAPLATLFLGLTLVLVSGELLPVLARALSAPPISGLRVFVTTLTWVWHGLLGLMLVLATRRPTSGLAGEIAAHAKASASSLAAVSLYVAGKYAVFTIGKLLHSEEMVAFFVNSGLPAWMHWFVMGAEVAGACGILLHGWLGTGPLASIGLLLLLVGAIHTHWRNRDPLSDSYDAILQLIDVAALLGLYLAKARQARRAASA
jgi:hypothetical protein